MSKEKKTGMRYLTVPEHAETKGMLNVQELPFDSFFAEMLMPKLNKKTETGTKLAKRLIGKIMDCTPGDVIELTDSEHEVLVNALPEEIPGRLQVKLIDFFDAITSASSEPPKAAEPEEESKSASAA